VASPDRFLGLDLGSRTTKVVEMVAGEVVMAGGVALNLCIVELLAKKLGHPVIVPANPQIVTAIGAALTAARRPE